MQPFTLQIGNLTPKWPIIQGGMGVGISLSRLAGAVAASGGVGVISAAQPGYNWDGFDTDPLGTNLKALAYHIAEGIRIAAGGIVGVNIMCAARDYAVYVRATVEAGAHLIISGAGLPAELPELTAGSPVKIAPIVSSAKAAKVLLTLWDRRYGRTADLVVIEGPKAGGHLGFTAEEAVSDRDYLPEIQAVQQVVADFGEKYDRNIPVVFGGGLFDSGDIARCLGSGLDGVQMATRFVATEECDAHPNYKKAYVTATPEDITIIKSPVGMPGRALRNPFVEVTEGGRVPIRRCWRCLKHCDPSTAPYCISQALIDAAAGRMDEGLIFSGSEVGRIHGITTVPELMRELTGEDKTDRPKV